MHNIHVNSVEVIKLNKKLTPMLMCFKNLMQKKLNQYYLNIYRPRAIKAESESTKNQNIITRNLNHYFSKYLQSDDMQLSHR